MSNKSSKEFKHNPFGDLKQLRKQQKAKEKKKVSPPPPPKKKVPRSQRTDEELFAEAMGDVQELDKDKFFEQDFQSVPEFSWEESMADFEKLFSEEDYFNVFIGEEYIEGHVHDLDHKLCTRLKRGHYSLQAHLDLHGMVVDEAKEELREFVEEQQRLGHRCVLIIHGRGLHSLGNVPILKHKLANWMSRGFLRKKILAFASANPQDGGTGAVYVLLRKRR